MSKRMSTDEYARCVAEDQTHQAAAYNNPIRIGVAVALGATALVSGGGEFFIGLHAFQFFAPLPGDETAAGAVSAPVMACSSLCAAAAFHLFSARHADAWPVRILNTSIGGLALGFICTLAWMAARTALGDSGLGGLQSELFNANDAPADVPFLGKLFELATPALSVGLWALALCNFWLAQTATALLWKEVKNIHGARELATRSSRELAEVEAQDTRVIVCEAEQKEVLRQLSTPAAWAFAHRIVGWIHEGLAPIQRWLDEHKFKLKGADNSSLPPEILNVDIAAVEARVAAIAAIDASTVYAAFNSDPNDKPASNNKRTKQ